MPLEKIQPGYLAYLSGEARDDLNRPFDGDDSTNPSPTAYRTQLKNLIDTHMASDVAGQSIATFVEELPYHENFGYRDALIGIQILRDTQAALDELLDDDEALRNSVRDERNQTDDETDDAVKAAAKDYDEFVGADEKNAIAREGSKGYGRTISESEIADSIGEAPHEEIMESVYDDESEPSTAEVRLYEKEAPQSAARTDTPAANEEAVSTTDEVTEDMGPPTESPVSVDTHGAPVDERPAEDKPMNPALALFDEEPQHIEIKHPDIKGMPNTVFRESKKWLREHIIAIATGTRTKDSFPRIAPLIVQEDDPEFAMTIEEVRRLVSGVKRRFSLLRFSKGKHDGPGLDIIGKDRDGDPNTDDLFDAMGDLTDALGSMRDSISNRKDDEGTSFRPWNDDGDGWQEGDGDSWKNG